MGEGVVKRGDKTRKITLFRDSFSGFSSQMEQSSGIKEIKLFIMNEAKSEHQLIE